MVNIQALIDDAKCFETVRAMRWPDGVRCPGCGSDRITKDGRDDTQPERQRYTIRTQSLSWGRRRSFRTHQRISALSPVGASRSLSPVRSVMLLRQEGTPMNQHRVGATTGWDIRSVFVPR